MDIFQVLFYQPIYNLLMLFTNWFGSLGLSIVLIALLAKIITLPLTNMQIKNASKSRNFQVKFKEIKEKYKHNQEKLTKEMAKLQAQVLPGQLGGCLSIIFFLILFIQIRGVIIDLVYKGYHSFNTVSYTQNLSKKEDFIKYNLKEPLALGAHTIELNVEASNGKILNKVYEFEIVEDKNKKVEEIKGDFSENQKNEIIKKNEEKLKYERESDISVYNEDLDKSKTNIVLSSFLIFPTSSIDVNITEENNPDLSFYIRPPSNENIITDNVRLLIDGKDVTEESEKQSGEELNLNFLGVNLSKVATDFDMFNLSITFPYIAISILSGVSQYFVSKLYSGSQPKKEEEKKDNKKKDKKKDEDMDFSEVMAQSTKQMNLFLPFFTVLISLGYFGGASFIPMGVTIFWTAQNSFVIIQQVIVQRKLFLKNLSSLFESIKLSFNK